MRRREFITLLGGTAAWPLAARAQQQPAMPVIGFLNSQSPEGYAEPLRGLRQGLKESGYVEGENLVIEYRWADNQMERLPVMAAELVRRGVALIVIVPSTSNPTADRTLSSPCLFRAAKLGGTEACAARGAGVDPSRRNCSAEKSSGRKKTSPTGGPSLALSARAATTTIPIVFNMADDPVRLGLVQSLARPSGNLTGVSFLGIELTAKRLELLRELVPGTARVAVLVNPADVNVVQSTLRNVEAACRAMGLQIEVFEADNAREMETAFENMARQRPDVLFIAATPFLLIRRIQVVQRAALHRIPAGYPLRDFADVGGLMSYGPSLRDAYRQVGLYAGRILKGAKPQELPVVQSTKFELVINHPTARMLGLTVPPTLLASADEVIE